MSGGREAFRGATSALLIIAPEVSGAALLYATRAAAAGDVDRCAEHLRRAFARADSDVRALAVGMCAMCEAEAPSSAGDPELDALRAVLEALAPLAPEARYRVLGFAVARFAAAPGPYSAMARRG